MSRLDYVEKCKKENLDFLKGKKYWIRYKKKAGKPVGVAVAYENNGRYYLGVSKCCRLDKFHKHIGIKKALERAKEDETMFGAGVEEVEDINFLEQEFPLSMKNVVRDFGNWLLNKKRKVYNGQ